MSEFWELSEPVPAWGNLLRHAEGRLESETQWGMGVPRADGRSQWDLWYGRSGELQKVVIGNRWGVHDNFNAWDLNLVVWEFA